MLSMKGSRSRLSVTRSCLYSLWCRTVGESEERGRRSEHFCAILVPAALSISGSCAFLFEKHGKRGVLFAYCRDPFAFWRALLWVSFRNFLHGGLFAVLLLYTSCVVTRPDDLKPRFNFTSWNEGNRHSSGSRCGGPGYLGKFYCTALWPWHWVSVI